MIAHPSPIPRDLHLLIVILGTLLMPIFPAWATDPPKSLAISVAEEDGSVTFRWPSEAGMRYCIRSVAQATERPPSDWPVYRGLVDLLASPPENTIRVARPVDPTRLFVVTETPHPGLLLNLDNERARARSKSQSIGSANVTAAF